MRIILIGRGKMGTLIRETAAAAGDEIEAVFGRDDLGQLGQINLGVLIGVKYPLPLGHLQHGDKVDGLGGDKHPGQHREQLLVLGPVETLRLDVFHHPGDASWVD